MMDMYRMVVRVVFSCVFGGLIGVSLARDDSGGCVYKFEVWKGNQNMTKQLQDLEKRCESINTDMEHRIDELEHTLLKETWTAQNRSHTIERQMMQYRLEDVQRTLEIKDVRLEMADVKSAHHRLWQAFDDAKLLALQGMDIAELSDSLSEVRQVSSRLQNGVGDLKAEWLLIKREVQDLKADSLQLKFNHNDMQDDAIKLKQRIEDIWGEMQKLISNGGLHGLSETDGGNEGGSLMSKLGQLNKDVETEMAAIRSEWQWMKQELLSNIVPEISKDDLTQLLNKPPVIPSEPPKDCDDVYRLGYYTSGVYQIMPSGAHQVDNVYCEMINGTGWTLLQRRVDGTLSFNRMWLEYMAGFGNLYGEFWLGNERIHTLTSSRRYKLRVDMWEWDGKRHYEEYSTFKVDSKRDSYRLHIRGHSGNAGDSLSYHDEMAFSTKDSDNDLHPRNCASENKGGWWFNSCLASNLNGMYKTGYYTHGTQTFPDGIVWYTLKNSEFYSLKAVEMKIKPIKKN